VIGRDRFATWEAHHASFRFIRTLTRGAGPPPRGRVPALLPRLYADLADHDVFIAGAPGFVLACATATDALGARRERVHREVFFVEAQPWTGDTSREASQ
jgi:CDP-4-dehydro-6-deoxyglucose reductase, E3